MSGYSEESHRLARRLAVTVDTKLRQSGRRLIRDPESGLYSIAPLPSAIPVAKGKRSIWSRLRKRREMRTP